MSDASDEQMVAEAIAQARAGGVSEREVQRVLREEAAIDDAFAAVVAAARPGGDVKHGVTIRTIANAREHARRAFASQQAPQRP